MPVVTRFPDCRIRINAKDHPPPHFHVLLNDGREAWVTITELKIVLEGRGAGNRRGACLGQ
jgi:hypothetical protein